MVDVFLNKYMNRNISLLYIFSGLMWARFYIPVIALFYIASQVSVYEFTIILSVFALVTLLLEIPSGIVADFLGKKNTLIISTCLYLAELVIVSFANGFWPFLVAKIISGIGVSLASGTGAALLYDSLKKTGRIKEHKKISGIQFTIRYVSMGLVFTVGAFIFSFSVKMPAIISIPFIFLGLVLLFFIKEPFKTVKKFNYVNSLIHFKQGLKEFKFNENLRIFAFFSLIVGSIITIIQSTSSLFFEKIMIPVSLIGIISFIAAIVTAFMSKQSDHIEKNLKMKHSIYFIQFFIFLCVFLMSFMFPWWGVFFYLVLCGVNGFFEVIINHYVNELVASENRATMLSINNFFVHIGIFVLYPVFGVLTERFSMSLALLLFAVLFLVYSLVLNFSSDKLRFGKKV
ncbi:MFS transporter [Candidatus Woesearchaeota archaeon]|nr:MFS transporter [Candidatus Woesearchaeota archaeon]